MTFLASLNHAAVIFAKGGPMMIVMLLCSVVAVYIFFQKLIYLKLHKVNYVRFTERVKTMLLTEGRDSTIQTLGRERGIISRAVADALRADGKGTDLEAGLKNITHYDLPRIEKNIGILSSMITVAPMLGLLGTVFGLIEIFRALAQVNAAEVNAMYAGISVALINTVAGLSIAIPCVFFHHYLTQEVELLVTDMERAVHEIVTFCHEQGVKP
ncbi:MAG: MotA/TolQ/ExbB proton channel family protein [Candidatus Margulisiibacteriota bacterium]